MEEQLVQQKVEKHLEQIQQKQEMTGYYGYMQKII